MALLFRKKEYTFAFILWAAISCFSRIYLGVHYLGDILCGATLGILSGLLVYYIYKYLNKRYIQENITRYSRKYTSSGYLTSDINILLIALFATIFIIMILGMIIYNYKYL